MITGGGHGGIACVRWAELQTAADLASFAFAKRFGVGYGCRIVLADSDSASLSKAESELKQAGVVDVLAVETDVADLASVEKLRDTVDAKMGGADVVLLAAAVSGADGKVGGPYSNIEAWQKVRRTHSVAPLTVQVLALSPVMLSERAGHRDQPLRRHQRHPRVRARDGQAQGAGHDHLRRLEAGKSLGSVARLILSRVSPRRPDVVSSVAPR